MKLSKILQKAAERLPGGIRFRVIGEYLGLQKESPYYRNLLRLSLRSYFCIPPHHGLIRYRKVDSVPPLYHITEKENLPSILKTGLRNPATRAVFLTNTPARASGLGIRKHLQQPVLLKVDSERMLSDGYPFFLNLKNGDFWITEQIPVEYISIVE